MEGSHWAQGPYEPRFRFKVSGEEILASYRRVAEGWKASAAAARKKKAKQDGGGVSYGCACCVSARARSVSSSSEAPDPAAIPELPSQLSEELLGIRLDEWQKKFIDTRAKRRAIAGARQCGKSMAVAVMAVHRMLTRSDAQVIVLAKSGRQSALFVEKCRWILRKLGFEFGRDASNSVSIRVLANGSKMIGLPCAKDTIRGFTADLLIVDEAAYVPDTVYMAARPMLASTDGDLVIMSTANEPVGFFWEAMTRVVSAAVSTVREWFRMTVRAGDVSRFARDFLEDERRSLGAAVYAREYECVFEDAGGGVFQRSIVEAALTDDVKPLLFGT